MLMDANITTSVEDNIALTSFLSREECLLMTEQQEAPLHHNGSLSTKNNNLHNLLLIYFYQCQQFSHM